MIDWGDTALQMAPAGLARRSPMAVAAIVPRPAEERRLLHFDEGRWEAEDSEANELLPTSAALAELIVGRLYRYHTLDDQIAAMRRDGIVAARPLLAGWINRAADQLQPLVGLIADEGREASLLAAANLSFGQWQGQNRRLWLFDARGEEEGVSGPARPAMLWLRLTPDRLGGYAAQELAGFAGRLQAAPQSGYDRVASASGQPLIGCWSLVRLQAEELASQAPHAFLDELLRATFRLRQIEAQAPADEIRAVRQSDARPVLASLALRLAQYRQSVDPFSALGGFLQNLDATWPSLSLFLEDERIALENKAMLRLRKIVAPENRWVFGRRQDSRNSAVALYTLAESCAANGIDPAEYFAWALSRLRTEKPAINLKNLLPWRFGEAAAQGFGSGAGARATAEVNSR